MANNRAKQVERYSTGASAGADPLREIADAVFERITDASRPAPTTLRELATEIEKENKFTGLSTDEKNFLWDCLTCVQGGEDLTEDDFFERAKSRSMEQK